MFDQTFVDGTQQTNKPYTVFLSTLAQAIAIVSVILGSILYTRALPEAELKFLLIAPPAPALVKPLVQAKSRPTVAKRSFQVANLVAPVTIPKTIQKIVGAPSTPTAVNNGEIAGQADFADPLLFGSGEPSLPPPTIKIEKPNAITAVRVGGSVAEANLVRRVEPIYPALAKSARVQGDVEFTAVISNTGKVEHLRLLRGHPLLVNAARDAILQWQYRPTLLNGKPVEVMTTITVRFMLTP